MNRPARFNDIGSGFVVVKRPAVGNGTWTPYKLGTRSIINGIVEKNRRKREREREREKRLLTTVSVLLMRKRITRPLMRFMEGKRRRRRLQRHRRSLVVARWWRRRLCLVSESSFPRIVNPRNCQTVLRYSAEVEKTPLSATRSATSGTPLTIQSVYVAILWSVPGVTGFFIQKLVE